EISKIHRWPPVNVLVSDERTTVRVDSFLAGRLQELQRERNCLPLVPLHGEIAVRRDGYPWEVPVNVGSLGVVGSVTDCTFNRLRSGEHLRVGGSINIVVDNQVGSIRDGTTFQNGQDAS